MRILYLGDIFGKPGRRAVRELVPQLVKDKSIDLVFANAENICGGAGIDRKRLKEVFDAGVSLCSSGNHTWHVKEIYDFIDKEDRLVRPANLPEPCPGNTIASVVRPSGTRVAIINLLGRVFMEPVDCPFRKADELLKELEGQAEIVILDFHAEATAEKLALAHYLDGRISAVLGTHTHVQTADEQIMGGGTAYITDMGMTGPHDSVIGVDVKPILEKFLSARPMRYHTAKGGIMLNGVILDIDEQSGKVSHIERVRLPLEIRSENEKC